MSTKRITLNMAATYAQTFVSLVIGLLCSRWVYNALGETQFGLFAVVGSLISFVSVLNSTLVGSSGRFFAFALGRQSLPDAEKELLCKWFNTALSVQTIVPAIMIALGGPLGTYAILHLLNIPDPLRQSCVYIFYFSLFSAFSGMILSPVHALYYAKQFIFVRNLLGIANTLLLAAEGWWLLHFSGNRLVGHAAATTFLLLLSNVAIAVFARWQFPEVRIRFEYWFDRNRLKQMFSFSSFLLFGTLGTLFGNSGVAVLLNAFFGPAANAAMGIGNQVFYKSSVTAQAFSDAITPELTTRVGADRFDRAKRLALRSCMYSTAMALLIAAPFIAYSDGILTLWLKSPPQYAAQIAVIMMMNLLAEQLTSGYMMLVQASGRIKLYTTCLGIGNGARCLLVLILLSRGVPLLPTLWLGWFLPFFILNQMRVWFAKRAIGISIREYVRALLVPAVFIVGGSFAFSFGFKALAGDAIWAILACAAANVGVVAALTWTFVGAEERKALLAKALAARARVAAARRRAASTDQS